MYRPYRVAMPKESMAMNKTSFHSMQPSIGFAYFYYYYR